LFIYPPNPSKNYFEKYPEELNNPFIKWLENYNINEQQASKETKEII
jgi:hypothetical protein